MRQEELIAALHREGIDSEAYSLDDEVDGRLCRVTRPDGTWTVFFSERGMRWDEMEHKTQEAANSDLFDRIIRDETARATYRARHHWPPEADSGSGVVADDELDLSPPRTYLEAYTWLATPVSLVFFLSGAGLAAAVIVAGDPGSVFSAVERAAALGAGVLLATIWVTVGYWYIVRPVRRK